MEWINDEKIAKRTGFRLMKNRLSKWLFMLAASVGLLVLGILIYRIFSQGYSYLDLDFFTSFASRRPEEAGIKAAILERFG